MIYHETLNNQRECCTVQHDLPIFWKVGKELFDDRSKLRAQQLIRFIHNKSRTFRKISNTLSRKVQNPTGGSNNNMYNFIQPNDIVSQTSSSRCHHDIDTHMLSEGFTHL